MSKYPVLRTLALVSRVAGWIAIGIGGLLLLIALIGHSTTTQSSPFGSSSPEGAEAIIRILAYVVAVAIATFGLILVILGEMIQVFLDIEENTRDTAARLRKFNSANEESEPVSLLHRDALLYQPCPSCGAKNETGARFCEQCGKAL